MGRTLAGNCCTTALRGLVRYQRDVQACGCFLHVFQLRQIGCKVYGRTSRSGRSEDILEIRSEISPWLATSSASGRDSKCRINCSTMNCGACTGRVRSAEFSLREPDRDTPTLQVKTSRVRSRLRQSILSKMCLRYPSSNPPRHHSVLLTKTSSSPTTPSPRHQPQALRISDSYLDQTRQSSPPVPSARDDW